MMKSENN